MEIEQGMEGGAWIPFAGEVHCSMVGVGPASHHTEFAHIQYVVGAEVVGTDDSEQTPDIEVGVAVSIHKEEPGHREQWSDAEMAGR